MGAGHCWRAAPRSPPGPLTAEEPCRSRNAGFSASPADAPHALVHRVVFLSHLPQRFQLRGIGGRLRLAPGGGVGLLSLITGLPLGLGLDEAALVGTGPQ